MNWNCNNTNWIFMKKSKSSWTHNKIYKRHLTLHQITIRLFELNKKSGACCLAKYVFLLLWNEQFIIVTMIWRLIISEWNILLQFTNHVYFACLALYLAVSADFAYMQQYRAICMCVKLQQMVKRKNFFSF